MAKVTRSLAAIATIATIATTTITLAIMLTNSTMSVPFSHHSYLTTTAHLDEADINNGVCKRGLASSRNEGRDQENADDYLDQLDELSVPGNSHAKMIIDRTNQDGGVLGRDSVSRDHLLWAIMEVGGSGGGGERDGGGGGGGGGGRGGGGGTSSVDRHERYVRTAKVGQCKDSCRECKREASATEGSLNSKRRRLVKWEAMDAVKVG